MQQVTSQEASVETNQEADTTFLTAVLLTMMMATAAVGTLLLSML